jgi:hypothetical protein
LHGQIRGVAAAEREERSTPRFLARERQKCDKLITVAENDRKKVRAVALDASCGVIAFVLETLYN